MHPYKEASERQYIPKTRWEYRYEMFADCNTLNALGEEGWELVSATCDTGRIPTYLLFLKREKL